MPCAAERAIESSRYASKHVWDLVSPAPDYSDTDLRIVAGFLKWSTERLAPHSIQIHNGGIMFMDIIRPASTAFGHLKALHDAEGATPNYRAAWKDFYDTFIRRFLGFVEFRELKLKLFLRPCRPWLTPFACACQIEDLLHADFLAVYQHLKSVPSVQELDIKTCAIVWKGYYQGWMNLDGWQKLVVSLVSLSYRRVRR